MRRKKNITLNLRNITPHFTGKAKIITLVFIIIMLSFVNIIFTSALSYQNSVGVGFTFDPTLSVNISPSDLTISNLSPGTTADSNIINVSVATNAAYGYTLSVNVNNESLVHSNNINTFNSIATDADLSDLEDSEDTNIWGYSTSLDGGATWSNYNGLSSSNSTTLLDANSNVSSNLDFKIAAKASSTQASGTYTGVINFTAVSKVAPMSLLDSFIASGAEQLNGYYKMQDMTHDICNNVDIEESELQLIDVRDNKVYWVAKLKDGNCWMTQNLDLDLSHEVALTSDNTDLSTDTSLYVQSSSDGPYALDSGYTISTVDGKTIVSWTPERSTYTSASAPESANWAGNTGDNNTSGHYHPYSWNRINSNGGPVYPDSTVTESVAGSHAQSGNYYNWSAAVASNNSLKASGSQENSICSKGWRLPANGEYEVLYNTYKTAEHNYNAFGLMASPLWFVRPGFINGGGSLNTSGIYGFYWSSMISNSTISYYLYLYNANVYPNYYGSRFYGLSARCMASTS